MACHASSMPAVSGASEPPATTTSASPERINRRASPMAMADDAHATDVVVAGPPSPSRIAMCAAAALCIAMTISIGEVRARPRCSKSK